MQFITEVVICDSLFVCEPCLYLTESPWLLQVRLNRDYPNRAKFEPDQGFDPSLDLALVGADWQIKVQGLASNWQDNLVVTSNRTGEQDALSPIEVLLPFLSLFHKHDSSGCAKNGTTGHSDLKELKSR
jgi:hypothetical protein